MEHLITYGQNAKSASAVLRGSGTNRKNEALYAIAAKLKDKTHDILAANREDLAAAKENGVPDTLLDRLTLTEPRIMDMITGIHKLISLDDPIGEIISMSTRPNGMTIGQKRVPLGVVAIIYEARPNVTVDAATLCLKSSNAVILKGGKEAIMTNRRLGDIMREAIEECGLPRTCIQVVRETDRETTTGLMRLSDYIDVLIPRGGAGLIKSVLQNASIPVIETGTGNCHIYVDEFANLKMAEEIVFNAKTTRPSVCNSAESMLIHQSVAEKFLPSLYARLQEKNVKVLGCPKTCEILKDITPATEADFAAEFLDYIISCKVVSSMEEAINHINRYGTGHSEAIVTSSYENSQKFLNEVDAAAVYVNASTRFTDGFEFGLGAEIGISTQKMHARGPMGLKALTSYKYIIYGNGQTR